VCVCVCVRERESLLIGIQFRRVERETQIFSTQFVTVL